MSDRSRCLYLVLGLAVVPACGPAVMGPEERRPQERVQIQRRPAEMTVYDKTTRQRFRVDLASHSCYEVFALLDHCPPGGDRESCPRTRESVRAANARARQAGSIGGCERDGCADVEIGASCEQIRSLDERVAQQMVW